MDACVLPPPSKRLIFPENQRLDIISSLRDDILHYILSFVSTKDATRTYILSKRWLNLRISSPTIIFVDKPSSSFRISLKVVDKTLIYHDSSDIRKLCLVLSSPVDFYHLRLWINTAKTHNVQSLDLNLLVDDQFQLPQKLYRSQNLVELKLCLNCVLKAPRFTQFSVLRSLYLSKIIFYNRFSFLKILTSCPVLEELALVNCEWMNVESLSVTMPVLRSLTIEQNLVEGNILYCFISFSAPNLSSFNCSSNLKVFFCLDEKPSLESALLDIRLSRLNAELSPRAVKLLKDVQYVKYLSISYETFLCFFDLVGYQQNLQPFENLTHLEINTAYNVIFIDILLGFLDKVPNLEFLNLSKGLKHSSLFRGDLVETTIPSCFNSSLKKIRITNFEGIPNEMALLKFLLQNVTVLEKMLIYFSDQLLMNPKKFIAVRHQIEVLPRGSDRLLIYH